MKNLLVSFSGGETSAFMSQWLNNNYEKLGYENIVFVFANTGEEREETLEFVYRCDKHFGLMVQWVEAEVKQGERAGTGYTQTDFDFAKRNGEPFEAVISKYGIPNQSFPHCTRELKERPIRSFGKTWFSGEKYHTAIGIRSDEFDRMNPSHKELNIIYPLIHKSMIPATKPQINFYWRSMPFRLMLKGYEGNCKTCWKKSDKKLFKIAQENPGAFSFMSTMEQKYPRIGAEFLKDDTAIDRVFFRGNRSANVIIEQSKSSVSTVDDDSQNYTQQLDIMGGESCELFSECVSSI